MNLRPLLFALVAVPVLAQVRPVYQDIRFSENPTTLTLANAHLRLSIDRRTGQWTELTAVGGTSLPLLTPTAGTPALVCRVGGAEIGAMGSVLSHRTVLDRFRRGVTLEVTRRAGTEYELTECYTLLPDQARLERQARLTRLAPTPAPMRFEAFVFGVPGVMLGPVAEQTYDVPGPFFTKTYVRPETPFDSLRTRTLTFHNAPEAGLGILSVSNRRRGRTLTGWMDTRGEVAYNPGLRGDGQRISWTFTDHRYNWLRANETVVSDVQVLVLTPDLPAALAAYRQQAETTMPLAPTPDAVRDLVILEVYPEAFKSEGFRGLTKKLPEYRRIGFNTIYLMPHWKGGYMPVDPFVVEPKFGTEADLQEMVRTAHALGMKVFFDMVIHGLSPKSRWAQARDSLFIQDAAGTPLPHPVWKSTSTDWADPAYQQFMVDLVRHDLKTYDIDGYRVDAATYKGPSWEPNRPEPPYRAGAAAPELMQKMLAAMQALKPGAVLLSEVFGPAFYTVSNLVHDNQCEAPQYCLEQLAAGRYTARDYWHHLANVYDALPRGANRVLYTRNHDTSWFFHFNGYTKPFFAFEAVHALFGIPEVFAGDPNHPHHPDDDPAVYATYARYFEFRQANPVFRQGEVRLRDAQSDNAQVFAGTRALAGQTGIGLVSFSERPESVTLTLQVPAPPAVLRLRDVLTGQFLEVPRVGTHTYALRLQPYQVLAGG
jgi:glycosidase